METKIVVVTKPSDEDRNAILSPLREYNESQAGSAKIEPLAILLEDDNGNSIGGLWGQSSYDWMFVQYLAVPDPCRGSNLGTRLMQTMEGIARQRGCVGIWLDTYSFQARGFYEKLGYYEFGCLDHHPVGHKRHFMCKVL
jgi:GNAT superfamily N-acetyltransferase